MDSIHLVSLIRLGTVLFLAARAGAEPARQERQASPAVVNAPLPSALRQTLSLDGEWDFATDPAGVGEKEEWFRPEKTLPGGTTLRVPGCWEAQGVGGPGDSNPTTPERSMRPLRGSYQGTAWYRREVVVPVDWAGRQIWLKIGGVHAQGWFWVNGAYLGHNACYCGTYKYNVTDLLKPGVKIVVVAKVRNDVPSRKGLMSWIHRFGGLYRSVELEATPGLLIDDVWVGGDVDRRTAQVHVTLRTADRAAVVLGKAELQVALATLDGRPAGTAVAAVNPHGQAATSVTLSAALDPFHPWSPEAPNLYRADVVLKIDGQPVDGWVERFGVRKWEVRGGEFYLNNRKYFIRGFGDDCIYPLTLSSPASVEVHRRHLQQAKSYGFAYVRHHTHCELPEFYQAADEVGIMVQAELPYYGNTPSAGAEEYFDPKKDLEELYTHYRRFVSLATYCTGNEGHLGSPIDREVYQLAKKLDPARLALHQDGGANRPDNSDFGQGPTEPWEPGTQNAPWPFFAHEYLNLATMEDPRLADRYTGAVRPPVTFEMFDAQLKKADLSREWGTAILDAGNRLQSIYQKRGLEQARLDPACDGYIYWTIVDVGSPSAQGLFNQFWEAKASTADYFRAFNSPTVILARFSPVSRILNAGEPLVIEWWVSAFGSEPLGDTPLTWRLGEGIAAGEVLAGAIQTGDVKSIGRSQVTLPAVDRPAKIELVAEFPGTGIRNSWDVWLFPRPGARLAGEGIGASPGVFAAVKNRYPGITQVSDLAGERIELLLADRLDARAVQALNAGKSVLLLKLPGLVCPPNLSWWALNRQAGTAIARHAAFGDFPHDGYMNELWFRVLGQTVSANYKVMHTVEPLMVNYGTDDYLIHVFQARVGKGRLLASGLKLLSGEPEAVHLLDIFIRYAQSSAFQPAGTLDPDQPGPKWSATQPTN